MFDLRPVGYVIGLLVAALGATMAFPLLIDLAEGNGNWQAFLEAAVITMTIGGLMALACANSVRDRLSIQQNFLLTTGVWVALPIFGALPFVMGATDARFIDAFFEAMSGLTTTGSTVFSGLETLPKGLLFWRALLQWFGGIGIIVVAMVFLPELRVGGMQIFRSEGFDTQGKILPRATEIASRISVIYFGVTVACAFTYLGFGMAPFDAATHAMTTVATGGFANYDASFAVFGPGVEYAAVVFMILAALPFVRFVQLSAGSAGPLLSDTQIRGFLMTLATVALVMALWQWNTADAGAETSFRKSLFNVVSILTGTGYASADYMTWGAFPIALFFFIGLIGGCAGSTACSVKIFRYQLLIASIKSQVRRIHSPHGLFPPRYAGRSVSDDVLFSVMAFFVLFIVTLGVVAILLAMTGLDFITSISGASAALANIGPGLGTVIGPSGNFAPLSDTAKWILAATMLVGRLELMAVYVLFTAKFWRG
ncbi:MAG: TrkH family potassium uptake protein [Marinosulfonomonas sp.]|nr:TrkH family potassium uptake protein [Marinosulfonomonas sp.]